jgi:membrane-bound metal-dependent hydrolase YbcI (DUF457 family)
MILGHLTVTSALHREIRRRWWPSLPVALGPLLIGAYLPDLLDKPLAIVTGLAGRGYGHSLIVQVPVFLALWALLRGRARLVGTLALGSLVHLIEDTVSPAVLLAPLLGPIPFQPMEPLLQKLAHFYTSGTVTMWIELAALAYWMAVGVAALVERSTSPSEVPGS